MSLSKTEKGASSRPIEIAIVGADGRMGGEVLGCVLADPGCRPVALLTRPDSPLLGELGPGTDLVYSADIDAGIAAAQVVIDFSAPGALASVLEAATRHAVPLVCGTTGLGTDHHEAFEGAAGLIPLLYSPNMSVGVQVMLKLLESAVLALGDDYDIEIVESHHRHKVDAPSGTAKRLQETLLRTARREGRRLEIPVHSIRGGDVVGDHSVHFMGDGDRIEITHRATTRRTFAVGALRAALWLVSQPPGFYGIADMLGLPVANEGVGS